MSSRLRVRGFGVVLAGSLLWGCGSGGSPEAAEGPARVDQAILQAKAETAIQPQSLSVYGLEVTVSASTEPGAPASLGTLCIEGWTECVQLRFIPLWGQPPAYWTPLQAFQTFPSVEELTKTLLWGGGLVVRGHRVQATEIAPEAGPVSVELTIDYGAIPPLTLTRLGEHTWVVQGGASGSFRSILEAADAYLAPFPPGEE